MKYLAGFTIFLLLVISVNAQEIAITIDDAPRPDSKLFTGEERSAKLIENLKKARVEDVLLFVKTGNINDQSRKRLEKYIEAGFHLANHSNSHFSADKVDIEIYLEDITTAHRILEEFDNFIPLYRHPFLHHGNSREKRDRIRNHLQDLGYQIGYVTIDNYEWYMDALLQRALGEGKKVNYETLKEIYVETLWETIIFYDNIARQTLGRSPKHVLLVHENDITALYIGDLVEHIRSKGWRIISPKAAYTDSIASIIPDVLFNGQGRVAAIARSKGWKRRTLVHEAEDENYLKELFERKNVFE